MIPLRDYQRQVKAEVVALWLSHRFVLAVSATGSGKTVLFSDIIASEPNASCVIAHRHELVSQISLALARNGVRHRVIGSPQLAKECTSAHMEELGVNYVDPNSRVAAASVDTLIRMDAADPWFASVKLWVMDECFPAGTMIGDVPIEQIKVGDIVDAFNEKTGLLEKRKVVRLFRNPAPKHMVRLVAGHHVLDCTLGHPIFTQRGWVDAGELTVDDKVLENELHPLRPTGDRPKSPPNLRLENKGQNILHPELRVHPSNGEPKTSRAYQKAASTVYCVWGKFRPFGASLHAMVKSWAGVLQQKMLGCLSLATILGNHERNQPRARFGAHGVKQSDVSTGNTSKGQFNVNQSGAPTEATRGQWSATNKRGNGADSFVFRSRLCESTRNKNLYAKGFWVSNLLQAGYGALGVKAGTGSRRCEPPRAAEFGLEKRSILKWVGVDSVEIYERAVDDQYRRSDDDGFVYNFEVEGLHTYIANGVVAHNCHHLLQGNKWGKAVAMFVNARGLGVTAETERADGYGLGAMNDGIFEAIVLAPDMREIINRGYLTDYRVFCPPSDLDLTKVDVGPSGDYVPAKLSKATKASHITGDVVKHYMRIAPGKLGICFAVDIESAGDIAAGFRDAGINAEVVSSKTPAKVRRKILREFRDRKVCMLVNVDLFGEGFDLPAIEVVIMARATASFNLYKQQFGRALRLMPGKEWAIIIDHVGNVIRHGLPDQIKLQTLGRPVPKSKREADENLIPMTTCAECTRPYERTYPRCKWCGHGRIPAARSGPEFVDGDLLELTQEVLAKMRGEAERITAPCPVSAVDAISGNMVKMHNARAAAQNRLREVLGLWAAWQQHQGRDEHFIYRLFYLTYGVDIGTAQTLGATEANDLRERVQSKLNAANVTAIT